MSRARHPKPYNDGPRKQMTAEWKQLVDRRLKDNKLSGLKPANRNQLEVAIGAKKGGINRMLSSGQTSSSYVDRVCKVLDIDPPLRGMDLESDPATAAFLAFPPEIRKRLLDIGERLLKK